MPEHTIDHPYRWQEIPAREPSIISIWVGEPGTPGAVNVAGAVKASAVGAAGSYNWQITSTLAPEVPVMRARNEEKARAFLVFLADLYTGRLVNALAS